MLIFGCLERAAVCNCGTPWAFLLPLFLELSPVLKSGGNIICCPLRRVNTKRKHKLNNSLMQGRSVVAPYFSISFLILSNPLVTNFSEQIMNANYLLIRINKQDGNIFNNCPESSVVV